METSMAVLDQNQEIALKLIKTLIHTLSKSLSNGYGQPIKDSPCGVL